MKKDLSKYVISWLILVPTKGKATKKDVKTASKIVANNDYYFSTTGTVIITHQPNREAAFSKIEKLKGKLSKSYRAYVVTDKQFGETSKSGDILISSIAGYIKVTAKQKADSVKI